MRVERFSFWTPIFISLYNTHTYYYITHCHVQENQVSATSQRLWDFDICETGSVLRSSQSMTLEMACSSNSRFLLAKSRDIWDVQDTELTAFQQVSQTSSKTVSFSGCWIWEVQETRPKKHLRKRLSEDNARTEDNACEKIGFIEGSLDSSFDVPLHC